MQRPRTSSHLSKGRWFHWESVFAKRKGLRLGGDWKESVKVEGRGKWGGEDTREGLWKYAAFHQDGAVWN